jgi:hypothetical protein
MEFPHAILTLIYAVINSNRTMYQLLRSEHDGCSYTMGEKLYIDIIGEKTRIGL